MAPIVNAFLILVVILLVVFMVVSNTKESFVSAPVAAHTPAQVPVPDAASAEENPQMPDECRNGLYKCIYRHIPLGF